LDSLDHDFLKLHDAKKIIIQMLKNKFGIQKFTQA
jgi:hypothetical protein